MDPFFAKNRLSAYIDGALPEREASEVAEAIAHDPDLKAEYEALRLAVSTLRQHGPVSAPEGFRARVMTAVEREPSRSGVVVQLRRVFSRVPVEAMAVAAAALLVVFATASQMQSSPALQPETPPADLAKAPASVAKTETTPDGTAADLRPATAAKEAAEEAPVEVEASKPSPELAKEAPQAKKSIMPQASNQASGSAYVPEWEAQQADADPAFGGTEGMALAVSDPEVLQKLYVLAERQGGRMLDEASQPLRPYSLSSDNPVARVLLLVPVDRAAGLRSQLEGLGAVAGASPASAPTLAAGFSGFYVEANLLP